MRWFRAVLILALGFTGASAQGTQGNSDPYLVRISDGTAALTPQPAPYTEKNLVGIKSLLDQSSGPRGFLSGACEGRW